MIRTSVLMVRGLPRRSNSPSWMTRSSLDCSSIGISPISSRKMVPPSASSKRPICRASDPVKAPRSRPKSSLSTRVAGSVVQLTVINGRCLPVPCLAEEQDRHVHGRDLLDLGDYIRVGLAATNDLAEVVLLGNILPQIDVLGLETVLQLIDFRMGTPEGLLYLLALLYFLRELHIRPGQFFSPLAYNCLQFVMCVLQFLFQLFADSDVDN